MPFCSEDGNPPFFYEVIMKIKRLSQGALFCALYIALTHLQNILLPGSASFIIQVRVSEALCILAFFTPAAIGGLTLGCFLFNLTFAASLPLDIPIGTLATFLSVSGMYLCRNIKLFHLPVLGLLLPAVFNGLFVGGELTYYFGGGFIINFLCVFAGEFIAVAILGSALYFALKPHASLLS